MKKTMGLLFTAVLVLTSLPLATNLNDSVKSSSEPHSYEIKSSETDLAGWRVPEPWSVGIETAAWRVPEPWSVGIETAAWRVPEPWSVGIETAAWRVPEPWSVGIETAAWRVPEPWSVKA